MSLMRTRLSKLTIERSRVDQHCVTARLMAWHRFKVIEDPLGTSAHLASELERSMISGCRGIVHGAGDADHRPEPPQARPMPKARSGLGDSKGSGAVFTQDPARVSAAKHSNAPTVCGDDRVSVRPERARMITVLDALLAQRFEWAFFVVSCCGHGESNQRCRRRNSPSRLHEQTGPPSCERVR